MQIKINNLIAKHKNRKCLITDSLMLARDREDNFWQKFLLFMIRVDDDELRDFVQASGTTFKKELLRGGTHKAGF